MNKRDDLETCRMGVAEMAAALKAGHIEALVELANTLQVATDNEKFVALMLGLIFELLPPKAKTKILASTSTDASNIVDFFTREPRD